MGLERVSHYIDNVLTQAEARMGLRNTRLLVAWYTNQKNDQSVVHSHPYHKPLSADPAYPVLRKL